MLTPIQIEEIIAHAVPFEFPITAVSALLNISQSYDIVSYLTLDGQRFGVIHSFFEDPSKFASTLDNKQHSLGLVKSSVTHKRECIKEYLRNNNCHDQIVYCLVLDADESEDYE